MREDAQTDDKLLFETERGSVRLCPCQDTLVLLYLGHWMALTRDGFHGLHARLIEAVRCPLGQIRLDEGGLFAFRGAGGDLAFALGREGMEDLLWLLDSARFMLEARDAAAAGFREPERRNETGAETR